MTGGLLASCERAEDRAVEHVVEKALAEKGRDAKVEIDRERGTITVDLGETRDPEG